MKERSLKRKYHLKKAREAVKRKKQLSYDMAIFLTKFHLRSCTDSLDDYGRVLSSGFKGFHNMRSKELVKSFEAVYTDLRDKDKLVGWINNFSRSEGVRKNHYVPLFSERNAERAIQDYILDSDALMNRLMELAFNLDTEE